MTRIGDDLWIWQKEDISPIEGMEYRIFLNDMRCAVGFSKRRIRASNPRVISPRFLSNRSQTDLTRVLAEHPDACIIVRYKPESESDVPFVRSEGLGLSWEHGERMTRIGDDLWILERGKTTAIEGTEYKILLNDTVWEATKQVDDNRILHAGISTIDSPQFVEEEFRTASRALEEHPHMRIIVRYKPKSESDVPFVRGEGLGLSWEHGERMTCIGDDLWILEKEKASDIDSTEYKILLNNSVWETAISNHIIYEGIPRIISPQFT